MPGNNTSWAGLHTSTPSKSFTGFEDFMMTESLGITHLMTAPDEGSHNSNKPTEQSWVKIRQKVSHSLRCIYACSPPVGKLLLSCDSEWGLTSSHTSVRTTVMDREMRHVTSVNFCGRFLISYGREHRPSYLAYLVSEGRPKKAGAFCDSLSLREEM